MSINIPLSVVRSAPVGSCEVPGKVRWDPVWSGGARFGPVVVRHGPVGNFSFFKNKIDFKIIKLNYYPPARQTLPLVGRVYVWRAGFTSGGREATADMTEVTSGGA